MLNSPSSDIKPVDKLEYSEITLNKSELLKNALANNPDIRINRFRKEKFSSKLSLTRSELLPNFSFRYYTQKTGDDADYWGMELGMGLPLWFWWENTGSIKEAGYELDIANSEVLAASRNIENDLNSAYEEFKNSSRQAEFFRLEAMPEADEILRQAKKSYEEGAIDYVEYLQALQIIYDTRTQYLSSLYTYYSSITKLEKLTGGDIK
ncbi:MAG: TolC family protein [Ignavibacteria bacterium]|nr:TolC family protein [Ignavibacteria bacterium]